MAQDPTPLLPRERLTALGSIPSEAISSPGFVVHLDLLEKNCQLLAEVAERSGARILLALKGFAAHATFPLIRKYLSGTTSSGLHEARLAEEFFGDEVHVYCPAYKEEELRELSEFAHTLVFNSPSQLTRGLAQLEGFRRPEIGLRVNPEYSEVETDLYDPCSPDSRLGTTQVALEAALAKNPKLLDHVGGLHFHALCEQDADALDHTINAFEKRFGPWLPKLKWVNVGGGHHITRPDYDVARLVRIVREFRERHGLEVYLEPGEAVALHTGILVVTVLDIVEAGGRKLAILDTSATCHMPDVLEMPYRPNVLGAGLPDATGHTYRLGGLSCLAGDVIGDYSFENPLEVGQRLVFIDMSHYTMVKTTTFNGVPLPSVNLFSDAKGLQPIRKFGYSDYRDRLS
jgi:carboxynorspermidine decarboxylase